MDTPAKLGELLREAKLTPVALESACFDHPLSIELLMDIHLGVGMPGRRISSLGPAGSDCRDRVESRLRERFGPSVRYRPQVVWAVAERI
jgi:hypothetical protein